MNHGESASNPVAPKVRLTIARSFNCGDGVNKSIASQRDG